MAQTPHEHAEQVAARLRRELGCKRHECRTSITLREGKKRYGYRVIVCRYSDKEVSSAFVWNNGEVS